MFTSLKFNRSISHLRETLRTFKHIAPDPPASYEAPPALLKPNVPVSPDLPETDGAPFRFNRTTAGNFPVYFRRHKYPNGKKWAETTIVKNASGDLNAAEEELKMLCESTVRRFGNWYEIKGNHKAAVRMWLESLGF